MKRGSYNALDYGSEFEQDSEVEKKKNKRLDLADKPPSEKTSRPHKTAYVEERSRDEARYMRHHYVSTNAYARHKELVNNYLMYYGGKLSDFTDSVVKKTDRDIIRENHQFVWEDGDEGDSWDKRLAKKYYDKLFKEYCLADLSRYKENKIALRWRTEREVISGKGQFVCGNKKCDEEDDLRSWEVNFSYVEKEVKKNCLVKLRLCPKCSDMLNYHHKKREVKRQLSEMRSASTQDESVLGDAGSSSTKRTVGMDDIVDSLLL